MLDLRKANGNLPEKGNKYDEARHEKMKLHRMFAWDFISLPTHGRSSGCACGRKTVLVLDGVHLCSECLSARNKVSK